MSDRLVHVAFNADDGGGTDRLSWGQSDIWRSIVAVGDSLALGGVVELPADTTIDTIQRIVRYVMERHQSLRTTIHTDDDGRPRQVVAESGSAPLDIIDVHDTRAHAGRFARTVLDRYERAPFDHSREFPVRIAVVCSWGRPTHVVTAYSHVALDAHGLDALLADLTTGIGGVDPAPPGLSPLEQAAQQRTSAARQQNAAALAYTERILTRTPTHRFRANPAGRLSPRWRQLAYGSPALLSAASAVAQRDGVTTTSVVLAAYARVVSELTGADSTLIRLMVSNRFRRGLAASVSSIAQSCLILVDVADKTFDELVAAVSRAVMVAGKYGYFDPDRMRELVDSVQQQRSEPAMVASFNDRRRSTPTSLPSPPLTRAQMEEQRARAVVAWGRSLQVYDHVVNLHVNDAAGAIDLQLCADTEYLSPTEMVAVVRSIEHELVEAALMFPWDVSRGTAGDHVEPCQQKSVSR